MQHLVQGNGNGYHAQNSCVDIAAARSAAQNAISENEKIFPIFAQRLTGNDAKEFISTARKFSIWLSSERAYYPAARPKIVELLEIALSAFVNTLVHHSAIAEIAEHMRQLVQAVAPFKHLFRENELQSRVQRIIFDTMRFLSRLSAHATPLSEGPATARYNGLGQLNTHNPNWNRVQTSVPSPTHISLVNPYSTIPSVPDHHMSVWRVQPSLPISRLEKAGSVGLVHVDQSRAHNPSEVASPSQPEAALRFAPPATAAQFGESISPTVPSKPHPKCAQRAELSEDPIARDPDWFMSDQSTMVRKDRNPPSITTGQHSPPLTSDVSHVPKQSPFPKKKTARMVPSCRLPRRLPIDTAQVVDPGASTYIPPEPSAEMVESSENEGYASAETDQMDVDGESPSLERMESGACSVTMPETSNIQQVSRPEDLRFSESRPATTSWNVPSIEQHTPQTDYRSSLVGGETSLSRLSTSFNAHALDGMESIDLFTAASYLHSPRSELHNRLESTLPQSSRVAQFEKSILPPLVNALDPPLDSNFRLPQTPHRWAGTGGNGRRFDDEMSILHCIQGMSFAHTHVIDISLSESIFSKISKWVKRRSHPSEESERVCISLACYRIPEFLDNVQLENGKPDVKTLTSQSSCSWPSSNRLSLCVKGEERHTTITLSPPLVLTPDQCVDISSLMKPGNNTLEIRQKDDLSEHLVVFHAHPPTRSQLAELEVVKSADERWRRLLDVLSGRVAPVEH